MTSALQGGGDGWLAAASERFAAVHAEDPRRIAVTNELGATAPFAELYHACLERWVRALVADPPLVLVAASRCQHLRRWALPRRDFPAGPLGYKKWRATLALQHAEEAGEILKACAASEDVIDGVRRLLQKRGLSTDPQVQLFEDAICMVFLELELAEFAAKHEDDDVLRILQKTWQKMSPAGHAAALGLAPNLPPRLRDLVIRAVA